MTAIKRVFFPNSSDYPRFLNLGRAGKINEVDSWKIPLSPRVRARIMWQTVTVMIEKIKLSLCLFRWKIVSYSISIEEMAIMAPFHFASLLGFWWMAEPHLSFLEKKGVGGPFWHVWQAAHLQSWWLLITCAWFRLLSLHSVLFVEGEKEHVARKEDCGVIYHLICSNNIRYRVLMRPQSSGKLRYEGITYCLWLNLVSNIAIFSGFFYSSVV